MWRRRNQICVGAECFTRDLDVTSSPWAKNPSVSAPLGVQRLGSFSCHALARTVGAAYVCVCVCVCVHYAGFLCVWFCVWSIWLAVVPQPGTLTQCVCMCVCVCVWMAAKPTSCFHALRDLHTHTHTHTHTNTTPGQAQWQQAPGRHAASSPGKCPWLPQQEVHYSSCLSFCTAGVESHFNSCFVSLTCTNTTCEGYNVVEVWNTHILASLLSLWAFELLLMILNLIRLYTVNWR